MRSPRSCALRLVKLNAKIKALYKLGDELLAELLNQRGPGFTVKLPGGISQAVIVDNFAEKNTAFKATSHKRFDVKVVPVPATVSA